MDSYDAEREPPFVILHTSGAYDKVVDRDARTLSLVCRRAEGGEVTQDETIDFGAGRGPSEEVGLAMAFTEAELLGASAVRVMRQSERAGVVLVWDVPVPTTA